jgi:hypothetical protein
MAQFHDALGEGIIEGLAGATPKTLADIFAALTPTTPNSCHVMTAAASATLATLIGTPLDSGLRAITLKPRTGKTVYMNFGAAASSSTIELIAINFTTTKAVADTIQLFSAAEGPNVDLIQHI